MAEARRYIWLRGTIPPEPHRSKDCRAHLGICTRIFRIAPPLRSCTSSGARIRHRPFPFPNSQHFSPQTSLVFAPAREKRLWDNLLRRVVMLVVLAARMMLPVVALLPAQAATTPSMEKALPRVRRSNNFRAHLEFCTRVFRTVHPTDCTSSGVRLKHPPSPFPNSQHCSPQRNLAHLVVALLAAELEMVVVRKAMEAVQVEAEHGPAGPDWGKSSSPPSTRVPKHSRCHTPRPPRISPRSRIQHSLRIRAKSLPSYSTQQWAYLHTPRL